MDDTVFDRELRAISWWRHQMEAFSVLLAFCAGNSPVTGEFPSQRPVTLSFDVFFDLRLVMRLSKWLKDKIYDKIKYKYLANYYSWFPRIWEAFVNYARSHLRWYICELKYLRIKIEDIVSTSRLIQLVNHCNLITRNQVWISPREHYTQAWLAQIDKNVECTFN